MCRVVRPHIRLLAMCEIAPCEERCAGIRECYVLRVLLSFCLLLFEIPKSIFHCKYCVGCAENGISFPEAVVGVDP